MFELYNLNKNKHMMSLQTIESKICVYSRNFVFKLVSVVSDVYSHADVKVDSVPPVMCCIGCHLHITTEWKFTSRDELSTWV